MSAAPKAILTDIEGTTTPITFVHDVLFPYAAKALPDFVRAHAERADVAQEIAAVRVEIGAESSLDAVIETLLGWIVQDRKATPLKALQGMVWEQGYRSGALTAHVYPDAVDALRLWAQAGITLAVYSSGSAAAQKLLFAHTNVGDLTPLFAAYFDTTTGPKKEAASYAVIADALSAAPMDMLFLSDNSDEVAAALAAGMAAVRVDRERDVNAASVEADGQTIVGGFGVVGVSMK